MAGDTTDLTCPEQDLANFLVYIMTFCLAELSPFSHFACLEFRRATIGLKLEVGKLDFAYAECHVPKMGLVDPDLKFKMLDAHIRERNSACPYVGSCTHAINHLLDPISGSCLLAADPISSTMLSLRRRT